MKIQENKLNKSLNNLLENFRDYNEEIWELEDRLEDINIDLDDDWRFDEEELEEIKKEKQVVEAQLNNLKSKQRGEYENELKDLPPETDKRDFEGFRTDETDPSYWSAFIPRK